MSIYKYLGLLFLAHFSLQCLSIEQFNKRHQMEINLNRKEGDTSNLSIKTICDKSHSKFLGAGAYGNVVQVEWMNDNQKVINAACKQIVQKNELYNVEQRVLENFTEVSIIPNFYTCAQGFIEVEVEGVMQQKRVIYQITEILHIDL